MNDIEGIHVISNDIIQAKKYLHLIEQANRGNKKKAFKILQDAYGRTGKTRHLLLAVRIKVILFPSNCADCFDIFVALLEAIAIQYTRLCATRTTHNTTTYTLTCPCSADSTGSSKGHRAHLARSSV